MSRETLMVQSIKVQSIIILKWTFIIMDFQWVAGRAKFIYNFIWLLLCKSWDFMNRIL